jgi:hypothetical protein
MGSPFPMSTQRSLAHGEDYHLYLDYADETGDAEPYLRIDSELVSLLTVIREDDGLSILIRLPRQVFPILKAKIRADLSGWQRSRGSHQSPECYRAPGAVAVKGKLPGRVGTPRRSVRPRSRRRHVPSG